MILILAFCSSNEIYETLQKHRTPKWQDLRKCLRFRNYPGRIDLTIFDVLVCLFYMYLRWHFTGDAAAPACTALHSQKSVINNYIDATMLSTRKAELKELQLPYVS